MKPFEFKAKTRFPMLYPRETVATLLQDEAYHSQEAAMHFAISIPQHTPSGTFDPAKLRDYLTRAESLGFHSAWTQEAALSSAPLVAPLRKRPPTGF